MLSALLAFDNKKSLNKVVILGDMMELGKYSLKEHDYILNRSLRLSFEKIITIGTQFYTTTKEDGRILKFENIQSFKKTINHSNWKYNHALIKGSRALQLEDLIPFFETLVI
jgi:UDP-N-acetylmuramoyl-tripeptide--D-alanyl-D-alanine ligase